MNYLNTLTPDEMILNVKIILLVYSFLILTNVLIRIDLPEYRAFH